MSLTKNFLPGVSADKFLQIFLAIYKSLIIKQKPMKKFTILFLSMLAFAGIARSQFHEDFEHIRLNVMFGGAEDNSSMKVVPNPDKG